MRRRAAALVAVVLLAGAGACSGSDDAGPPAGRQVPARVVDGSVYAVGRSTFEVTTPSGRRLPVDALYPTDEAASAGSSAAESPAASRRGPFPVVIFSHGNAGTRTQSDFLLEALASRGFVVLAPDHVGNTGVGAALPFDVLARERPADVRAVAGAVTSGNPATGDLAGAVDAQRIGVVGYSFGGYTALATAAGVPGDRPDPQIDAVVALAPAIRDVRIREADLAVATRKYLPDDSLRRITVPTLVVGGVADQVAPVPTNVPVLASKVSGRPLVAVTVERADHYTFTRLSDDVATQQVISEDVVSFLRQYLAGVADADHVFPRPGVQAVGRIP